MQQRGGKSAGAIRVSLGLVSNFADAIGSSQFAEGLRDQTRLTIGNVTFDIEAGRIIRMALRARVTNLLSCLFLRDLRG